MQIAKQEGWRAVNGEGTSFPLRVTAEKGKKAPTDLYTQCYRTLGDKLLSQGGPVGGESEVFLYFFARTLLESQINVPGWLSAPRSEIADALKERLGKAPSRRYIDYGVSGLLDKGMLESHPERRGTYRIPVSLVFTGNRETYLKRSAAQPKLSPFVTGATAPIQLQPKPPAAHPKPKRKSA
jgi:hypothetical protein